MSLGYNELMAAARKKEKERLMAAAKGAGTTAANPSGALRQLPSVGEPRGTVLLPSAKTALGAMGANRVPVSPVARELYGGRAGLEPAPTGTRALTTAKKVPDYTAMLQGSKVSPYGAQKYGEKAQAAVPQMSSDKLEAEIKRMEAERSRAEHQRTAIFNESLSGAGGDTSRAKALTAEIKQQRENEQKARKEWEAAKERENDALRAQGYRDATLGDLTLGSISRGFNNARYGQELNRQMEGAPNKVAEYEEKLAGDKYKFITEGWGESAVSGGAELLGQQGRQWTDPRALATGLAAGGAAAVAGQLGPQLVMPEEVITVPAAFFGGIQAGSAVSNYEIESGHAYKEMLDNGISPETARNIARVVGAGNAALELVQMDELMKSFKVLDRSGATQGIAQQVGNEILRRGAAVGKETLQEVAQEGVTIMGAQVGSMIDNGQAQYGFDEVMGRLGDTAASSALSFGMLNVPGGVRSVVGGRGGNSGSPAQGEVGRPQVALTGAGTTWVNPSAPAGQLPSVGEPRGTGDVFGQQKTAPVMGAEKINPGARPTVREQVGDMPSQDYGVPKLAMPQEVTVDAEGNAVTEGKLPAAIRKYMIGEYSSVINVRDGTSKGTGGLCRASCFSPGMVLPVWVGGGAADDDYRIREAHPLHRNQIVQRTAPAHVPGPPRPLSIGDFQAVVGFRAVDAVSHGN